MNTDLKISDPINEGEWCDEDDQRKIQFEKLNITEDNLSKLKGLIRSGIPNDHRPDVWLISSGGLELLQEVGNVYDQIEATKSEPYNESIIAAFGCPDVPFFMPADSEFIKFMNIVKNQNLSISYSPMLPAVSALVLRFLKPDHAYFLIQAMLNQEDKYFTNTRDRFLYSLQAMQNLMMSQSPKLVEHSLALNLKIAEVALFLEPLLFLPNIKLEVALTFLDSFINEGRKVLTRFVIGIMLKVQKNLLKTVSADDFMKIIVNYISNLTSPKELNELLHLCFSLRISTRRHMIPAEQRAKHEHIDLYNISIIPRIDDFSSYHLYAPILSNARGESMTFPVNRHLRISLANATNASIHGGTLLSSVSFSYIQQNLAISFRRYDAFPVYLMSVDGSAFSTFLDKSANRSPYMIVIKTLTNTIGAIMSDPPRPKAHGRYFGTPSTAVFDVSANRVYRNTGANDLYMSVTIDSLAIGGPKCAIYIESGFKKVISDFCETFGSPKMTNSDLGDDILDIELYRLSMPVSNSKNPVFY